MGKFFKVLPRVLAIIYILFLALFALDVFEANKPINEIFVGLLIHFKTSYRTILSKKSLSIMQVSIDLSGLHSTNTACFSLFSLADTA